MKVCLGLDDFSIVNNRLDIFLKLKERFPDFKVSLFTVPLDSREDWGPSLIREESLNKIKQHLDWMQIIPHGLFHDGSEMRNVDYFTFKNKTLPLIKEAFEKDGLPYVKGFKAPHWRWSEGVVRTLDEEGWWGAIDRRQPKMLMPKRFYRYNYCLDESFNLNEEVLKLHGHVYGTSNDIGLCISSLLSLPRDTSWHFVTDFIEENK